LFQVRLGPDAREELKRLPAHAQRRIVDAMNRELRVRPTRDSKPRKQLVPDQDAGIEATTPVWQLRVGEYRVFYDVDARARVVMVQRIARKGRRTTGEVLR
jgi:mRNA-degrading endonuclease RelE of RelBE toxin-antitoxin system